MKKLEKMIADYRRELARNVRTGHATRATEMQSVLAHLETLVRERTTLDDAEREIASREQNDARWEALVIYTGTLAR